MMNFQEAITKEDFFVIIDKMNTRVYDMTDINEYEKGILDASETIKNGGIVVFPTETVYGLGADATNAEAVRRIFEAKGRPQDNPLIVHIADKKMLTSLSRSLTGSARILSERYMPGPITLVVEKNSGIADNVTAGLSSVGVRMPDHACARDFIRAAGRPVAAPSANISGKPSPTRERHVLEDMLGKADVILLMGECSVGVESTVVDCTKESVSILRPGGVSEEEIASCCPMDAGVLKMSETDRPRAPGMKYTHYKPLASVLCVTGSMRNCICYINEHIKDENTAAIVFSEMLSSINAKTVFDLGSIHSPKEAAYHLFSYLRECDYRNIHRVYVMGCENKGIGKAYMNRLLKASDECIRV